MKDDRAGRRAPDGANDDQGRGASDDRDRGGADLPAREGAGATASLAALVAELRWEEVPDDVRAIAKRALTDAIACGVAGSATPLATLARHALGTPTPAEAGLLGQSTRTTALMAAHHNALAINALDYDDQAPFGGHPGAAVVAAAFAAAERLRSPGRALLEAVLAGYEVAMRVQAAIRPSAEQYRKAHGNGTPLAFGAAAAAARLLQLDARGVSRAFGIAGSLSPVPHAGKFGWDEPTLPWVKDNVAWPAEAGLRAAFLAAAGMPASTTFLDGDTGFWRMAASDRCDWATLQDRSTFHLRALAFKTYPCCRWLHTMLDALQEITSDPAAPAAAVRGVEVATTEQVATLFGRSAPASMIDAQFSGPYAAACLLSGVPRAAWWKVDRHAPGGPVLRLASAVRLVADPALTERHARLGRGSNRVPARVTVTLHNGRQLQATCEHASGSPDLPAAGPDRAAEKAIELLRTRADARTSRALIDLIETLDASDDEIPFAAALSELALYPAPTHPSSPPSRKEAP